MISYDWNIVPYIGVGPLHFGLSREQIRAMFIDSPSTFRQGPYAVSDTDAYEELRLHLYYDSEDKLRCIMEFESGPIHFQDTLFLARLLSDVLYDLARLKLTPRYDNDGYWFDDAGFVLYAPDNIVKAVTVYRTGYYEEEVDLASKVAT